MSGSDQAEATREAPVAFFRERFGVDARTVERALGVALERRVDATDLYFEYGVQDAVVLEEGIVKSGERHVEQGVGVRVQTGERQGYAHSDEITVESLEVAATTARAISESTAAPSRVAVQSRRAGRDLYPVATAPTEVPVETQGGTARRDRRLRAQPRRARQAGDGERRLATPARADRHATTASSSATCGRWCDSTSR